MTNALPKRIMYPMIRVRDLEASLQFYCDALGMQELRRDIYDEGGFTLSFVGYQDAKEHTVIELTYNHGESDYEHGNAFGHIALETDDIYAAVERLETMGVNVLRPAGPMKFADRKGRSDVIAFVEDPDGYKIELIEAE